ncbi:c-type cytochrome [Acetobacter thailandicus]|uniref:c-type cytochrome n=1 Tax=Acetobacter thailandicus TaxID=1502842 RepID=UPI001BA58F1A|nr:cytochrome c [Acetobacter thailandicus]MBS0961280.1 cytochrome c [Acetobacter thailandicus]
MPSCFRSLSLRFVVLCLAATSLTGCSKKSPQRLYGMNCGICHHSGDGMPGSVPPVRGRINIIASTPEGKRYLADVLINGLSGAIVVDGKPYDSYMPSFDRLKDEEIATILNWLSARGDTKPAPTLTAADIAEARARHISTPKVSAERAELHKKSLIP